MATFFDLAETSVFLLAGFALLCLVVMHGLGELDTAPQVLFDVPLQDVCPPAPATSAWRCGYGAQPCHDGRCYGELQSGKCNGAFTNEAWLLALQDCAQPVWWPMFLAAFAGVWVLVRVWEPLWFCAFGGGGGTIPLPPRNHRAACGLVGAGQILFAVGIACLAAGKAQAYWVASALAIACASLAHGAVLLPSAPCLRLKRFVYFAAFCTVPVLMCVSVGMAMFYGYAPAESNQILVVFAGVVASTNACACLVACTEITGERTTFWHFLFWFLVDVAVLVLVVVLWAQLLPITWFFWSAYLFWLNHCAVRLARAVVQTARGGSAANTQGGGTEPGSPPVFGGAKHERVRTSTTIPMRRRVPIAGGGERGTG